MKDIAAEYLIATRRAFVLGCNEASKRPQTTDRVMSDIGWYWRNGYIKSLYAAYKAGRFARASGDFEGNPK